MISTQVPPQATLPPWQVAVQAAQLAGFCFHDLRHTAASYLAMSGCTLAEIGEVLGHRSTQTTKRYTHYTITHTAALVERMAAEFLPAP